MSASHADPLMRRRIGRCGARAILLFAFLAGQPQYGHSWQSHPPLTARRDGGAAQSNVGVVLRIDQLVLPGSELAAIPWNDEDAPLVVRLLNVYPHGTDYRYDLEVIGFEAGKYDLRDYLKRKDDSVTGNLPPLPIEIESVLPEGRTLPNPLPAGRLPRVGGYGLVMIILSSAWLAGLLYLIVHRRKKPDDVHRAPITPTLGDYLKPRIEAAIAGQLNSSEQAELERMILALWQKRLGIEDLEPAVALARLKNHPQAGPLFTELESAMHDPNYRASADLVSLLRPYENMSWDAEN